MWLRSLAENSSRMLTENRALEDVDVFVVWLKAYNKRAEAENIVSLAQVLAQFVDFLDRGLVKLPEKITLFGFDNPPPLYQRLFQTLEKENCPLDRQGPSDCNPAFDKKAFNNQSQEMHAAAQWSKTILEKSPSARIGIICPDLHTRKKETLRVFSDCFFPNQILERQIVSKDVLINTRFSSTASENLDSQAVIQVALMLLQLNNHELDSLDICQLLRSPFLLGAEEESAARASLEYKLRKNAELATCLANLRYLALEPDRPWHCPVFGKALLKFEESRLQHKGSRNVAQWSILIEQQLILFIDPVSWEQQQFLHQWHELLKDFKNMAYLCANISFSNAIKLLSQLARNTSATTFFNQAPVQILAPIEAGGLQYTHLWCMGLSEANWPPPAHSNPFIPIQIQHKYSIPAASTELQYQSAKGMLQQFCTATSAAVVFSYPLQAEDIALNPSLLLEEFSSTNIGQDKVQPNNHELNQESLECTLHPHSRYLFALQTETGNIDVFEDTLNIPLLSNEDVAGGTALIADQAACPFKSFAKYRLRATELPKVAYGLPAYAVGNMLHHAMEVFWQNLKDQAAINAMDSEQCKALVQAAASAGVKHTSRNFPQTMTVRYCELEVQRLGSLLSRWLDEERKRGYFTVLEHEYPLQWQYSNLQLNFRIDRLEQLEDESISLVDYKTSKQNSVNWLDARQDKPQLLLYLLAAENDPKLHKVSSLLYAQVNIEEMKYRGIAQNTDIYPGVALEQQRNFPDSITWDELREFWQLSLQTLAQEFIDGYLLIEPKSVTSCQYCHLDQLCRVKEQRQGL